MTDTVNGIAFGILALASVGGAVGMLTSRNVVHAAFWLLEISLAAVGLYYLLSADFVALVQLLVYAGAVSVLNLFTIMITLRRREDAIRPRDFSWPAALLAVILCVIVLVALVDSTIPSGSMPSVAPDIAAFGRELFSLGGWVLPFEIASLILLVALVAAVWWSREDGE